MTSAGSRRWWWSAARFFIGEPSEGYRFFATLLQPITNFECEENDRRDKEKNYDDGQNEGPGRGNVRYKTCKN